MPLLIGTPLPPLDGATNWLTGDPHAVAAGDGPLFVQFWSLSCPTCKLNMPRVLAFLDEYREHGLRLLSVHMPRGPWERDAEKVRAASEELGVTGPSVLDNAHALGKLYQTGNVWPSYFFFDAGGKLRSRAAGNLGLKMAENSLKRLLGAEAMAP